MNLNPTQDELTESATTTIEGMLQEPRWLHRTFNRLRAEVVGITDLQLRLLLREGGAMRRYAQDGKELWYLPSRAQEQARAAEAAAEARSEAGAHDVEDAAEATLDNGDNVDVPHAVDADLDDEALGDRDY